MRDRRDRAWHEVAAVDRAAEPRRAVVQDVDRLLDAGEAGSIAGAEASVGVVRRVDIELDNRLVVQRGDEMLVEVANCRERSHVFQRQPLA